MNFRLLLALSAFFVSVQLQVLFKQTHPSQLVHRRMCSARKCLFNINMDKLE